MLNIVLIFLIKNPLLNSMKKFIFFAIFVALSGALRAQTTVEELQQTDNAIKSLSAELARKLTAERATTVVVGQFTYMNGSTPFSSYLVNQLTGELADIPIRSFTLASGGGAQWVISGDIVRIGELLRVYTRLVRRENNALVSQIRTDLAMNRSITAMLSSGSGDSSSSSSSVMADEWETDSWEAPVTYSMDVPMHRTIHSGDHDWFLIETDTASSMVIKTTGETDTYLTLYDADTREELASNDDDGDDTNALIRYFLRPEKRYIAEVKGYSSERTGSYGFEVSSESLGDPIPYALGNVNAAETVRQRLGSGRDLFLLTPDSNGMLVMETYGSIDLVLELYDAETYEKIASDDDSGEDTNARIMQEVERGKRYLARVRAYSDDNGEYGFRARLYGE